ncbi:hypothetical protein AC623_15710 [Bacillus sp. FJAT-27231]|uniref:DUF86 domain-containing protein n=1 Tax=Bacillus sp. FJAT-27231 TaxID=1679168 RepID=UPI000670AFA1|nr:DUF86 domain-containing protein [Bacillus sp. FJAT-27231]KMY55192.1 hypothetical protein AC623_15710 [Bacillus sp. FJAT-27231]
MYFVDRGKIEEILKYMEAKLSVFAKQPQWEAAIEQAALERIAHIVIESMLDVGNAMIDGFIMRDPGSYEDIVDILEDEQVIEKEAAASLKAVVALRKMLVQHYTAVDYKEVKRVFEENFSALEQFPAQVRAYLTNELGPVSAFKP